MANLSPRRAEGSVDHVQSRRFQIHLYRKGWQVIIKASRSDMPPFDVNKQVTRLYGWPFKQEYMTEEENINYKGFGV